MGSTSSVQFLENKSKISHGISFNSSKEEGLSQKQNHPDNAYSNKSTCFLASSSLMSDNKSNYSNYQYNIPNSFDITGINQTNSEIVKLNETDDSNDSDSDDDSNKNEKDLNSRLSRSISTLMLSPSNVEVPSSCPRRSSIVSITEENGKSLKSFHIETFDYANVKIDETEKFHGVSRTCSIINLSKIREPSSRLEISTDIFDTVIHKCNLCSVTFDTQEKFMDHTKYSKIHMIGLLKFNSNSRINRDEY